MLGWRHGHEVGVEDLVFMVVDDDELDAFGEETV
jgi:hypothetical protein